MAGLLPASVGHPLRRRSGRSASRTRHHVRQGTPWPRRNSLRLDARRGRRRSFPPSSQHDRRTGNQRRRRGRDRGRLRNRAPPPAPRDPRCRGGRGGPGRRSRPSTSPAAPSWMASRGRAPPGRPVNAAGVLTENRPVDELPAEDFRRNFEVNVVGMLNACQALSEPLRAGRGASSTSRRKQRSCRCRSRRPTPRARARSQP